MSDRFAKAAEAQRLRDEGLLQREIAERMGVAKSTVSEWLCDPDGSKLRARKDSYRGTCVDCGARTDGSNGAEAAPTRCSHCAPTLRKVWTREAIIVAIQGYAERFGYPPLVRAFESDDAYPAETTVAREFGTWNAAIRATGLVPTREFERPYEADPTVLDRVVAAYREGYTMQEIAPMFGVSPTRVNQWLIKAGEPRRTAHESRRLREQREQVAA